MTDPSWTREPAEDDRTLEENWLFRLRRERFRSRASGKAHDFYVLHLADAVNVIALTRDRRLILVRQFRAGSGRDSLETPGGLVEAGEDPGVAGARELREETGFAGDPAVVLGGVWSNPSLMTSRTTTIVIANARLVSEPSLDYGEEVAVETVPARKVPVLIRDGIIDHALTVQGLLWWLAAEIPSSPLAPAAPGRPTSRLYAFVTVLAVLVYLTVASAVQQLVAPGHSFSTLSAVLLAIPLTAALTFRYLDPPLSAILVRPYVNAPRRWIMRLAAFASLTVLFAEILRLIPMSL